MRELWLWAQRALPSNFSVGILSALPVRLTLTLAGQAPAGGGAGQEGEKHEVVKIKRQPTGEIFSFSQVSKGKRKKGTVSSLLYLGSAVPSHHLLTLISWLFPDKSLSPWIHVGDGIRRERKWEGRKKEGGGRFCLILGENRLIGRISWDWNSIFRDLSVKEKGKEEEGKVEEGNEHWFSQPPQGMVVDVCKYPTSFLTPISGRKTKLFKYTIQSHLFSCSLVY